MARVDTNVLVRLLTGDDAVQSDKARNLVRRAEHTGERLYVPLTVTLELEFQDESAVENPLSAYRRNQVDFAECLHIACAHSAGQGPLVTFDRAAARLTGARLAI